MPSYAKCAASTGRTTVRQIAVFVMMAIWLAVAISRVIELVGAAASEGAPMRSGSRLRLNPPRCGEGVARCLAVIEIPGQPGMSPNVGTEFRSR